MGRSHRPSDTSLPLGDIPVGLVPKSVRPKRRVGAALGQRPAPTPQDPLAEEYLRLTGLGLIVDLIPVVAIQTARLQRDRAPADDIALTELKTSLREVGLSNPIRVAQSVKGTYELVQGFRRLTAFRDLLAETGEARWAQIPAGVLPAGQTDAALYRRMVDENLIRTDVSCAEMATLARGYA
ncbi:MAG: ParB N-terminal domain-containing protein, partial [Pseudomonadota bacterium]